MKVLHLVFSFKYGGIETMLVNIVNEQIKHTQVSIMIINDNYEQSLLDRIDKNVQIIKIGRPLKSKNLFYILKLNYQIKKISPCIIHSHNSSIIKYLYPSFRKIAVNTIHDTLNSTHFPYIRSYREIFAISKSVHNNLKEKEYDSIVVENGIQPDIFLKRKHHHASRIFKIVQIGRLEHDKKGQDILIKACSLLTDNKAVSTQIRAKFLKLYFCCEQNLKIMYSSEDLERFYFQYKTEALPLGMSIETFCLKNKVSVQKWRID